LTSPLVSLIPIDSPERDLQRIRSGRIRGRAAARDGQASAGRTALILSVLALLSVAVFWAGITPARDVGAIALGLSSDIGRLPASASPWARWR
jgi:hypothetical protein